MSEAQQLPCVTTIVLPYSDDRAVKRTLLSILAQRGRYQHEVAILANGKPILGSSCTAENVVAVNCGFAEFLTVCSGQFINVVHVPDVLLDPGKIAGQLEFMLNHPECQFCHSGHAGGDVRELPVSTFLFNGIVLRIMDPFLQSCVLKNKMRSIIDSQNYTYGYLAQKDTLYGN